MLCHPPIEPHRERPAQSRSACERAQEGGDVVEDLAATPSRFPVPSDVLVWTLDGARAVLRPSGTEPKLKAYAEVVLPVAEGDEVDELRMTGLAAVEEVLDGVTALLGPLAG